MNSIHDMGGMHGFGAVVAEADEPPFHAPWEGRVLAMQRTMGYTGQWTIDESRAAQEALPPAVYLTLSYYERWARGLEDCLVERGLVGADELAAGRSLRPGKPMPRVMHPEQVGFALNRGRYDRPTNAAAQFKPGDRVRTKNINPETHTRLPRYARGRFGVVEAIRGCHVFPDTVATGGGENPQWLYTVVFEGRELWGEACDPALKVSIEAFEPYLEHA